MRYRISDLVTPEYLTFKAGKFCLARYFGSENHDLADQGNELQTTEIAFDLEIACPGITSYLSKVILSIEQNTTFPMQQVLLRLQSEQAVQAWLSNEHCLLQRFLPFEFQPALLPLYGVFTAWEIELVTAQNEEQLRYLSNWNLTPNEPRFFRIKD